MTKASLFTLPSKKLINELFKAIIFITILVIVLSVIGSVIRKRTSTTLRWDKFYEKSQKENIDMLLLGSSQSFRGLDPRIFEKELNLSCYNISNSAQVISQTYYNFRETLKYTKPKIVLVETFFIDKSDLIPDRWYFAYEEVAALKMSKNKIEYILDIFTWDTYVYAFFPAIREHDNWADKKTIYNNIRYLFTGKLGSIENIIDGFTIDKTVLSQKNIQRYKDLEYHIQNFEIDEKDMYYVDGIVDLCRENDIKVLFVKTAMPKYHTEKTNYMDRYNKTLELANKYSIPYIDFNVIYDEVGFKDYHFRNEFSETNHHLNTAGAEITTNYLVNYLKMNNYVPE